MVTAFALSVAIAWLLALVLETFIALHLLRPLPCNKHPRSRKNLLIVIAHPDDESMFFAPTLLSMGYLNEINLHVLSLSTGNAEGIGATRKDELIAACAILKIPAERVEVLDVTGLQDGFLQHWDRKHIADIVEKTVVSKNINIILTFDKYGISGHPNHRDVHHGICTFLQTYNSKAGGSVGRKAPIEAWELVSINIMRKYCGPLDIFYSMCEARWNPMEMHCFLNPNPARSFTAMGRHKSQWLWYRRLFVGFARYTYVNTLRRIIVSLDQEDS